MSLRCENCGVVENVERSDELDVTLCGRCFEERADKADSYALSSRLDAVVANVRRYVAIRPEQANVIALWIAHTYVFGSFPITPYLNVKSATKQAGKTRLLEVIRPLTSNPVDCDGITPAALIRTVDAERPTLLLDEMDALFSGSKEGGETVRGILNSGFRARGRFLKCVGEGSNMTVREYATFCPKVLSGIGSLPDTVTDRSVPIKMHRRAPGEQWFRSVSEPGSTRPRRSHAGSPQRWNRIRRPWRMRGRRRPRD